MFGEPGISFGNDYTNYLLFDSWQGCCRDNGTSHHHFFYSLSVSGGEPNEFHNHLFSGRICDRARP